MIRALAFLLFVLLPSMVLAQVGQGAPASATVPNGAGTNPVEKKRAEATALYNEGKGFFLSGDFKTALTRFQAAMVLDPTANLQYNICRAQEQMRKPAETLACFKKYMQDYPNDEGIGYARAAIAAAEPIPPTPTSAPTSVSPLPSAPPETCVLLLREIPANADVKVNGKIADPKTPITTDCEQQRIEVLVANQLVAGGRVVTTRKKPAEWTYEPNTPADPALLKDTTSSGWGRRHWGWTSISVSALAAAAAGYFTYSSLANFAEADKRNGNHAYTVGEFRSAVSDGEDKRTLAIVSGVVAVVAGSLGGYLVLTGDDESPKAAIAPSFGGLVLTGTF